MIRLLMFAAVLIVALFGVGMAWLGNDTSSEVTEPSIPEVTTPIRNSFAGEEEEFLRVRTLAPEDEVDFDEPSEVAQLRRELDRANQELARLSRPLNEHILSSQVNAEIFEGESLVTGGYQRPDGLYELTFLTPRSLMLENDSQAIEVESQIVSINPGFVQAHGLQTLATNARNTLQHAEAWQSEDVAAPIASVPSSMRSENVFVQRSVVLPSKPFSVEMGDPFGQFYKLDATVDISSTGSYLIQSRIERTGE